MQAPLRKAARHSLALACLMMLSQGGRLHAQDIQVGAKVPDHDFQGFHEGDGRTKLSEFIGSPVLVEWWGTR